MKLSKRIFAFVLMISVMLSMTICGSAATFSDVPETHERYEAINELANLGIINGYTDGTFLPDKAVTRAEMAKLIAVLFNITEETSTANPFSDVDSTCWALNYIIAVKNLGIINGYPDGTFLPDAEVTYEQAIKMIVCALGYGVPAEGYTQPGDWSSGYRTMAGKLGLSNNAIMTTNAPAPRGIIAQLLYNALDIAPAKAVTGADGKTSYEQGDKPLKEQNDYKTLKAAQIICTPEINLSDSDALIKDGYVRILDSKGNKYDMSVGGNTGIYDLVGRFVNVTYEEKKKDYTIKSISDLTRVDTISLDKIKDVSSTSIEYYTNDKYASTSKINFKTPTVIYNERALSNASDFVTLLENASKLNATEDSALNFFGTVEVAKYNDNALIKIKSYKSYYMESAVNTSTFEVKLEGRTAPVIMDVKDTGNYEIVKKSSLSDKGTNPTTLSIPTKSVITISESYDDSIGSKYIEYIVNSSKATGTPTESTTPKGPYAGLVTIDKKSLYVTNEAAFSQMAVNSSSQYYTDASGNIVYIASTSDGTKRFGFFVAFLSGDAKDTDSAKFRFYDPETASTFETIISDPDDIENFVKAAKENGKLLWMNISGTKVKKGKIKYAQDVTTADDSTLLADVEYVGDYKDGGRAYKSSSSYTLSIAGASNKTISATSGAALARPDSEKSDINYSKVSMTVSSAVKYPNPEAYVIKRSGKTNTFLLIDPLKQLQTSSPVYVVKEISGSKSITGIDGKVVGISYYNFKTGAESTEELVVSQSVADQLELQKGDVFTYYSDSDTEGVNIDKTDNVFILLRASEVAANRGAAVADRLTDCDADSVKGGKTHGFKFFSMGTENNLENRYYNFSLQIPLWFDRDNSNNLYLARTGFTNNSGSVNVYTGADASDLTAKLGTIFDAGSTSTWTGDNIVEAMGADSTQKSITKSTKVFVYDKTADSGEPFSYKKDMSEKDLSEFLATVSAMTDQKVLGADEIESAVNNCALVFTYFQNYSSTLTSIYIIK